MLRRTFLGSAATAVLMLGAAGAALADDVYRIGLVLPLTGAQSTVGKQVENAVKLFIAQNGLKAGGKTIEIITKDDASTPDVTKRLSQELLVNDKVNMLAGYGITPSAMATAPLATQAKVPMVVMAAGTAAITEQSPFIVRTSFTLPQVTQPMADWALANKIKKVVTLVADYGPGIDAEKTFKERFTKGGGEVLAELRSPVRSPDFSPFLQRVKDLAPDAVFLFVPSGQGAALMKQIAERELDKTVKVIATGDVTDDDQLKDMGDVVLGMITSGSYSAAHPSPENKAFVEAFVKATGGRPNFMGVGGYDGMKLIYAALDKTKGGADGAAMVEAMKGMAWVSPRGPMSIDPQTRDVIQNIYLRKVEKVNGENFNVEFQTVENVKDPYKAAK